jgi:bacterioferritin-associated ferredoxin
MNTPTPTPRTDAAWAKTFLDDDDQCRAGNAASEMRDECATRKKTLMQHYGFECKCARCTEELRQELKQRMKEANSYRAGQRR